ncbi:MAG: hypothetical protein JWO29_1221 [Arthrobacter sp.]|nr:hypothetical protein [Arthrobacter sp.]
MATEMDPDKIEKDLQEALTSRMNSARALAESREDVAEAREDLAEAQQALNEAEQEDARRYESARRSGWTADELRQSGLAEPITEPTRAVESTEHGQQPQAGLPAAAPPKDRYPAR